MIHEITASEETSAKYLNSVVLGEGFPVVGQRELHFGVFSMQDPDATLPVSIDISLDPQDQANFAAPLQVGDERSICVTQQARPNPRGPFEHTGQFSVRYSGCSNFELDGHTYLAAEFETESFQIRVDGGAWRSFPQSADIGFSPDLGWIVWREATHEGSTGDRFVLAATGP